MGTHCMIFLTIGDLYVSLSRCLFSGKLGGGFGPPPPTERKDLQALDCYGSGDLVEGRV
jgi:hypothetical protein